MVNRRHFSLLGVFVAAVVLLFCLMPDRASAASSSEIKSQINDLQDQKQELKDQIEELKLQSEKNAQSLMEMVAKKNAIDQEIVLMHQQIENINQQVSAYKLLIADKQDELDEAILRQQECREENRERIRAMEEDGKLSYWSVLFKVDSFSDLLDRMNMVEEIAASDQRRLQALNDAAAEVAEAQAVLEAEKAELEQTRNELNDAQTELDTRRLDAEKLLQELVAQGEEFQQLLLESEDLQDELMREIAQKEKDYKNAQYQEWLATYVPPTTAAPTTRPRPTAVPTVKPTTAAKPTTEPTKETTKPTQAKPTEPEQTEPEETEPEETVPPTTQAPVYWQRPVSSYTLSSPFGMRLHPILGIERMHEGIDMSCARYTPIYATRSGVVTTAAYQENGAGNYVTLNHGDGFASIYMHMEYYVVGIGQYVTQGQTIGYVGSTGLSESPHLHFGITQNGVYVNPLAYIS